MVAGIVFLVAHSVISIGELLVINNGEVIIFII